MRPGLIGGIALAVLWFALGWASFALQHAGGSLSTLGQLVPSPMRYGVFGSPVPWAIVVQSLTAAALVGGYAVLASLFAHRGRITFVVGWLAAILSAFVIGASLDLGNFFAWIGQFGIRGALGTTGATPITVWWAVLVGWIPSLAAMSVRSGQSPAEEPGVDAEGAHAPGFRVSKTAVAVSLIALAAAIALPLAAQAGSAATQEQLRQEQAALQASADPEGAAPVDPAAVGHPVPTVAPTSAPVPAGACTAENTTILAPPADAATGHRAQSLQLVNTSDTPCVVNGYPDVVFGDQNGHVLEATVEHGRSFMAEDPGPAPITLEPGGAASAVIGWDANSVHGQLVARSLWVAVHPGAARLSWDVSLDIVPGATVHVTAWRVPARAGG